jgi:peptidyl-dipeptidase Dcp
MAIRTTLRPTLTRGRLSVGLLCACLTYLSLSPPSLAEPMNTQPQASAPAAVSAEAIDVLLAPWRGPYGGVPPFDRIDVRAFEPAFEQSMAQQLRDIDAITSQREPATFANTLVPLEHAGAAYDRVARIFNIYSATLKDSAIAEIETRLAPRFAAQADRVVQNAQLFQRIQAVHAEQAALNPEQKRLTEVVYLQFVRAGAALDPAKKTRLSVLNQELASLYTRFSQNLLHDEGSIGVELKDAADFAGLPSAVAQAYRAQAQQAGSSAMGYVANTRSSVEPFLEFSTRRDLRQQVFENFVSRGNHHDAHDNNAIITEILSKRLERAQLLGFKTHADWRLTDSMAKTPERAMALMQAVWPLAVKRVHEEVADMQKLIDAECAAKHVASFKLAPWDYRYYAEKVRAQRYALDTNEIKPYLQLDRLREGMFMVAARLFDLHFSEAKPNSIPVARADIRVFEVRHGDGSLAGLWYFDPFARPTKQSGAWMDEYRSQENIPELGGQRVLPIVSNNANFVKGAANEPVLISWEDAVTLFHEFGHALHGLSSDVHYPTLAGTNVARDYVEFPSQLLEHWLTTDEILKHYALHVKTHQPMPDALVAKIKRADKFNQGFKTVEYLSSALIDLKLHLATNPTQDPQAFERDTLAALDMPTELVMRHATAQFGHVFAGDGYSAGYYSYLWADTLSADAWEAFMEAHSAYDPKTVQRLRESVFKVGNTVDPAAAYRQFRGRDPDIQALLRKRGF